MHNVFDVTEFGAVADGVTDCTAAFQRAIDAAGEVKGTVTVPPGTYLCSTLYLKPGTCLMGYSGWGYRETGGSVLKLNEETATCLIDMSGAFGARVKDLQLLGNHAMGKQVHGIYVWWENKDSRLHDDPIREDNALPEPNQIGFREDSITVDNCQIKNFSGDAIHLYCIWAFNVRNCMLIANKGNAIYINGGDGWISDCIMHTNHGAGIFADVVCAAVTITGNRIEWNRNGGITMTNALKMQIVGNYFDRAYGPSIKLVGEKFICSNITATGNYFNRSGKYKESLKDDPYESCHLYLDNCTALAFTGNNFSVWRDDLGSGLFTPDYGIVYHNLHHSVISCNTLYEGAIKEIFVDLGENGDENVISNNPSSLFTPPQ